MFLYNRFLLVIHFIHISVYMSIPISQSHHHPPCSCSFHKTASSPKVMPAPWGWPTVTDGPFFQLRTTLKMPHSSRAPQGGPASPSVLPPPLLTPQVCILKALPKHVLHTNLSLSGTYPATTCYVPGTVLSIYAISRNPPNVPRM